MATIIVRVRTSARMARLTVPASGCIQDIKTALAKEESAAVRDMKISLDPPGRNVPGDHDTFARLGIGNGTIVFLHTDVAVARSTPKESSTLGSSGRFTIRNGRVQSGAADTSSGSGAGVGVGAGAAATAKLPDFGSSLTARDLARTGRPSKPSEDTTGDALEWLCTHPPHQMCTNCAPERKAAKAECQHGPRTKCVNCLGDGAKVSKRKHLTFQEYLDNQRASCNHGEDAQCPNCLPPSEVSYKLVPGCTRHKPYPRGLCTKCKPPPATLNRQKYRHVDFLEILNFEDVARLVNLWDSSSMTVQRAAYLLGRYDDDPAYPSGKKAIVEAIYEPPQMQDGTEVNLLNDPNEASVDRLLEALGLQRVGWVFTHKPRDYFVSSSDLRKMARLQNKYSKEGQPGSLFCSLLVTRNEAGVIEPRAFMASDQAMAMERDRVLGESKDPTMLRVRKPSGAADLVTEVIRNDKRTGAKEVQEFETEFLLVEVNAGQPRKPGYQPMFKHNTFPIENRELTGDLQSADDMRRQLTKYSSEPYHHRLSDFHALLFLTTMFDMETALSVAECVKADKPVYEGAELMLQAVVA